MNADSENDFHYQMCDCPSARKKSERERKRHTHNIHNILMSIIIDENAFTNTEMCVCLCAHDM
jgi:hypothetical protein